MAEARQVRNLYVHFPFCRSKCTYCALYSKVGVSEGARAEYVGKLAREIGALAESRGEGNPFDTVYFGGGSPALCELKPIFASLRTLLGEGCEFTVELHPHDVTAAKLAELKAGGVNRLSIGVQSTDDKTLAAMGRGYTAKEALAAVELARGCFENVGIDLIVGYPGDPNAMTAPFGGLCDLIRHCSVYSLQNERGLKGVPSDEEILDKLREIAEYLEDHGLRRYEISNYSYPGYECSHNLATWRGEDYIGLGEGAFGRVGLDRTKNARVVETVDERTDRIERGIFALRTRDGLDTAGNDEWRRILERFAAEGLVRQTGTLFSLTARGTEVCDTILAELI